MSRFALLDNVEHHDTTVAFRHGPEFGDAVNQLLLFPTEFEAAQREFPIVFRRDESGGFQAVALLGFDRDENLFLTSGDWQSRYIPAIQRRGPFRSAASNDARAAIHIDLDDPRVGAPDGTPIFLRHGGEAPCLRGVAAALETMRRGHEIAQPMYETWLSTGLLQPVELDVDVGDGARYLIPDLFTIAQDRLAALDGPSLERLHQPGYLRAALLVAASLGNIEHLIGRKRESLQR